MAVSYSREELGRGISLTRIYDKKFKSNCVKIAFISPLDEKTACVNAMLQTVLVTSNAEIPSRTKLTSTLTGLYGSSIGKTIRCTNITVCCFLQKVICFCYLACADTHCRTHCLELTGVCFER